MSINRAGEKRAIVEKIFPNLSGIIDAFADFSQVLQMKHEFVMSKLVEQLGPDILNPPPAIMFRHNGFHVLIKDVYLNEDSETMIDFHSGLRVEIEEQHCNVTIYRPGESGDAPHLGTDITGSSHQLAELIVSGVHYKQFCRCCDQLCFAQKKICRKCVIEGRATLEEISQFLTYELVSRYTEDEEHGTVPPILVKYNDIPLKLLDIMYNHGEEYYDVVSGHRVEMFNFHFEARRGGFLPNHGTYMFGELEDVVDLVIGTFAKNEFCAFCLHPRLSRFSICYNCKKTEMTAPCAVCKLQIGRRGTPIGVDGTYHRGCYLKISTQV